MWRQFVNQAEILVNEISQLREQYFAEVGVGRRIWPRSIKERVERLEALGIKYKTISQQTGIGYDTLLQWRYKKNQRDKKNFHEVAVTKDLVKVGTVTEPIRAKKEEILKTVTVTVTTPEGFKVTGDDTKLILEILTGLSRCF
jgi:DNA-binding Lrp family transcriptional regulator